MAPYGFSVVKQIAWRGGTHQFSNVYHYDAPAGVNDNDLEQALDAIVVQDKKVHPSSVTYVNGRVWGPTNQGPAASITRVVKDLSGVGTMVAAGSGIYKECAFLVEWYMGRIGAGGRKVWLRKYYHSQNMPASNTGALGDVAITQANKDPLIAVANALKNLVQVDGTYALCSPGGTHLPLDTSPTVDDYLRTRQFRA